MAQAVRKWNNIGGHRAPFFQKMGPNIAIFDLLIVWSEWENGDLLAFWQQFWQLLELQIL